MYGDVTIVRCMMTCKERVAAHSNTCSVVGRIALLASRRIKVCDGTRKLGDLLLGGSK